MPCTCIHTHTYTHTHTHTHTHTTKTPVKNPYHSEITENARGTEDQCLQCWSAEWTYRYLKQHNYGVRFVPEVFSALKENRCPFENECLNSDLLFCTIPHAFRQGSTHSQHHDVRCQHHAMFPGDSDLPSPASTLKSCLNKSAIKTELCL